MINKYKLHRQIRTSAYKNRDDPDNFYFEAVKILGGGYGDTLLTQMLNKCEELFSLKNEIEKQAFSFDGKKR